MVILAPMAAWKPFDGKGTRGLTYDIICAHTMVGTLAGSYAWANQAGNSYWHFGLAGDGRLWQCHDLAYRSAANLEGNWHVIPIETADTGEGIFPTWSGSDVPAWTPAQVDKLVELIVWLCQKFNIPPVLIPDTKPGRRGLAYHRQGINPWRVDGGELWSKANGKVCPGDRRIAQFKNEVVPRVAAAVHGEGALFVTEDDKTIMRNILKQEIPALVEAAVDNRFKTGGSATRQQIAGTADITSLVELGLQRSETFQELVEKVDALAAG